ncbi:LexA family protein [Streptomyces longispororuber]|uniref:LexA family protein n=1 Tax=Streptomyces longispororuber TaxID=68230 RepID=UPI002109FF9D|nr:hypothetical protein [Streptomyces longispororuber]MCQ4212584.1 hypothetical protein [Streptomyces longispororuber]
MGELTERQRAVMIFLRSWVREHREAPTLARIGEAVGLRARSSVHYQLRQLEALGLVRVVGGKALPAEWNPLGAPRGRARRRVSVHAAGGTCTGSGAPSPAP